MGLATTQNSIFRNLSKSIFYIPSMKDTERTRQRKLDSAPSTMSGFKFTHLVDCGSHSGCQQLWQIDRFVTVNCQKYPFKGRLELNSFDFLVALARIVLKISIATTSAEIKALKLSSPVLHAN